MAMSHLTLLAPSFTSKPGPALAHDIRNVMAVISLHVEMLEGPAGPLCNDLLRERAIELTAARRTSFDIVETIRQVTGILRPNHTGRFED
jgi:hypothetical protein